MSDRTPTHVLANHSHHLGLLDRGRLSRSTEPSKATPNQPALKKPLVRWGITFWTFVPTLAAAIVLLVCYCDDTVSWWVNWLLATPLYCYILICGHDAVHRTADGSQRINRLIGGLSAFVLAIPFSVIRRAHLSHHARVGKPDDIERFAYEASWTLPLRWVFGNLCYYEFLPKCTTLERTMAGASVVGIGTLLMISPDTVFFGWLLPMQTTWFIFMVLTVYVPHGPFAGWINKNIPVVTGYHEEHHGMPNLPWHQLSQRKIRASRTRSRPNQRHSESLH